MPTAHEALVDAVALAIANVFRADHGLRFAADLLEFDDPEHFRKLARAAIATIYASLREPSEEMMDAVDHDETARHAYCDMIDASPLNPEAKP